MLEPLTTGLVSAAVTVEGQLPAAVEVDGAGRGYPEPVADLTTTFWNALEGELRDAIPGTAGGGESPPADEGDETSTAPGIDWGPVLSALSEVEPPFRDEVAAVEAVVDALAGVEALDAVVGGNGDPAANATLARAVLAAYRETVTRAGSLAGTGLADYLGVEDEALFCEAVDAAGWRLGRLAEGFRRRGTHELCEADERDPAVRRHVGPRDLAFVPRPELAGPGSLGYPSESGSGTTDGDGTGADAGAGGRSPTRGTPDGGVVLVRGDDGTGKTRTLVELVDHLVKEGDVDRVLVPTGLLRHPAGLRSLLEGDLEGGLAVVWDDLDAGAPGHADAALRGALDELGDLVDGEDGVWALVAADAVPGDPVGPGESLPESVETVDFDRLDGRRLEILFEAALDHHGVVADDRAVRALADRARTTDPTPGYVDAVVRAAARGSGELTAEDADALPGDTRSVWTAAYDRLGTDGDDRSAPQRVLAALALLAATGAPTPHRSRLVAGVYEHVFGGYPGEFAGAVRTLVDRRWIDVVDPDGRQTAPPDPVRATASGGDGDEPDDSGEHPVEGPDDSSDGRQVPGGEGRALDGPVGVGVAYRVRDAALDVVPLDPDRHLDALSSLYLTHLDRYLRPAAPHLDRVLPPPDPGLERALHDGLATALLARSPPRESLAERHFARAVEGIDPDGPPPRVGYTVALDELAGDGTGPADDGDEAGPGPGGPTTAAEGSDGGPAPAAGSPADHGGRASSPGDAEGVDPDPEERALDPGVAETHHGYASLLAAAGHDDAAATHFERVLRVDPDHPGAHHGYANVLARDDDPRAADHYERALDLEPGDPGHHRDYGNFLADRDPTAAVTHYERAIELDPEFADAHYDHGTLRHGQGDPEGARGHYERAIEVDPGHARAHYNCALACRETGDLAAAADHLEGAIDAWVDRDRPVDAVDNLATLVEVLLDMGTVPAAREACDRGLDLIERAGLSRDHYAVRWIESEALRLAPETDLSALYDAALVHQVAGDDRRALFLLATLWDSREGIEAGTDAHRASLAAGVALAGHFWAVKRPDIDRPDGILARVEVGTDVDPDPEPILGAVFSYRHVLPPTARAVFDFLMTGETDHAPRDLLSAASGEPLDDVGRDTLEAHVFATLLDTLTVEDDPEKGESGDDAGDGTGGEEEVTDPDGPD